MEIPGDTEKNVTMYITDNGGKRPSPMSSKGQVAEGVGYSAKIVIANGKNDESTTVNHDAQFEISLARVISLTNATYKVRLGIGLTKTVLHLATCGVDTGERANLIYEDYLKPQRKCRRKRLKSPELIMATKERTKIQGAIPLVVQIIPLQVQIQIGIVQNLAANTLLVMTYIDSCIRGIFCMECKIVRYHLAPVATL